MLNEIVYGNFAKQTIQFQKKSTRATSYISKRHLRDFFKTMAFTFGFHTFEEQLTYDIRWCWDYILVNVVGLVYKLELTINNREFLGKKQLVDSSENVRWQHSEWIRTFRVIKLPYNRPERNTLRRQELVCCCGSKQSWVILPICSMKLGDQLWEIPFVCQRHQSLVHFDISVLADAQKKYFVHVALNTIIEGRQVYVWAGIVYFLT